MPAKSSKRTHANGLLSEFLLLAETESKDDRRSEKRLPCLRPVSIQVNGPRFSGFTREIGVSGIGLLPTMELPLPKVLITVAGSAQQVSRQMERCESIGEGWFISGGKLVGTSV